MLRVRRYRGLGDEFAAGPHRRRVAEAAGWAPGPLAARVLYGELQDRYVRHVRWVMGPTEPTHIGANT